MALFRGRMAFRGQRQSSTPRLLVEAAHDLESHDPGLASQIYLQAMAAASTGGTLAGVVDLPAVARASQARPPSPNAGASRTSCSTAWRGSTRGPGRGRPDAGAGGRGLPQPRPRGRGSRVAQPRRRHCERVMGPGRASARSPPATSTMLVTRAH